MVSAAELMNPPWIRKIPIPTGQKGTVSLPLIRFSEFRRFQIQAADGKIGRIVNLLMEDECWNVRYFIVGFGSLLHGRTVMISPAAMHQVDARRRLLMTDLNSQQVMDAPAADFSQPISRQYEQSLVDHYGWPIYWLGRFVRGSAQKFHRAAAEMDAPEELDSSSALRSGKELQGYRVEGIDGRTAGFVKDMLIQSRSWRVEYLSLDFHSWWPGERSLFSADWITSVHWARRTIRVALPESALQQPDNSALQHSRPITGEPYSAQPYRVR